MKIRVLRKMEYAGSYIYVMQFGWVFQYLLSYKGEIYQDYVTVRPALFNLIKYWLRITTSPFDKSDTEEGEQVALSGAMKTMDALIDQKQFQEKQIRKMEKKGTGVKCQWRSVVADNGMPAWQCLLHSAIIPMIEGEKPSHLVSEDSAVGVGVATQTKE